MNSWRRKLAHDSERKVRGKWNSRRQIPAYMEVVEMQGDLWTLQPSLDWIEQAKWAQALRDSGLTWDAVSDRMEQIQANMTDRPMLPRGMIDRHEFMSLIGRRETPERVDAMRDWFDSHEPALNRSGYCREWSVSQLKRNLSQLPLAEEMAEQMGLIA